MSHRLSSAVKAQIIPLLSSVALFAAISTLIVAAASAQTETETNSEVAAANAAEPAADDAKEWLVDEATGRRYHIEQIPKVERAYHWADETRVRFPGGASFIVESHDDEWFHVRVYEKVASNYVRRELPKKLTDEEKSQLANNYAPELEMVDRVQMKAIAAGLPTAGQWRNRFDVADMNGDGHMDIVFGPARKGRDNPNIFLGDGEGNWQRWQVDYPPQPYDYGAVAAGDLNADGHQDLVFGIHLRGMLALIGDGEGGFTPWTEGIELDQPGAGGDATSFSSRRVEIHDWNGDGRPDIVAYGEGPKGMNTGQKRRGAPGRLIDTSRGLLVYVNNGDGSWQATRPHGPEGGNFGDDFAFGDFDGDGDTDIVLASRRSGSKQVLGINDGNGELAITELAALRGRPLVTAVEAADLDGDGNDEAVIAYLTSDQGVWITGLDVFDWRDGTWHLQPVFGVEGRESIHAIAVGRVDGDEAVDIVALTGQGRGLVFLNDGKGGMLHEESPELPVREQGCQGQDVHLVDVAGDGQPELLASFAGESVGYPGLDSLHQPGCPGGGSIHAWQLAKPAASPKAVSADS